MPLLTIFRLRSGQVCPALRSDYRKTDNAKREKTMKAALGTLSVGNANNNPAIRASYRIGRGCDDKLVGVTRSCFDAC